ncbi:YbhN family protein [Patescibacteria group bacterium]
MKKSLQMLLKILVSGTLLTIIFLQVDKETFFDNVKLLDLRFAPLIVLLIILNYVVGAYRWKSLLIHNNAEKVSVKYLIYLYFTGAFFNNFMPTTVGGDVYKVFKLGKKIDNTVDAFSATFMERFTGVIALVFISVVSLVQLLGMWGVILLVGFFISIIVGYLALGFLSNKYDKLTKIYNSISAYRGKPKVLWWAFITSFAIQLFSIFTQYFIFLALGIPLPIVYSLFIFPVITLAGFFIPSLNGVGVQDALFMKFFITVGVAAPISLSASIIYHLFRLSVSLIGGVFYAMGKDD